MSFREGENVGPYRVMSRLGQGGMATVYKAYHPALDRCVAIKVLHPAFMEDPNFLARFQREARVVAKLDHPNIVPIYDFADHAGQPYLVMKFIDGETLKARLPQTGLPSEKCVPLVEAVGSALAYAHDRGILHRDIKPSNILLTPEEHVYLADFGLARIAEAGQSTLSSDRMLGTPQYISPEQAQGVVDLDAGTDIYSLGIVLYEMVVGKVPFNADTPFSIIHDHIYTPLPLPSEVNPFVDVRVEQVLLKALAKERSDRFREVDELVAAYKVAMLTEPDESLRVPVVEWGAIQRGGESVTLAPNDPHKAQEAIPADLADSLDERIEIERSPIENGRKKLGWIWVVAGLGLSALCFFTFLIVFSQTANSSSSPLGHDGSELIALILQNLIEPVG